MRRGRVRITFEALASMLLNTADYPSVSVEHMEADPVRRTVDIYVSAPDDAAPPQLRIIPEGGDIPVIDIHTLRDVRRHPAVTGMLGENTTMGLEPVFRPTLERSTRIAMERDSRQISDYLVRLFGDPDISPAVGSRNPCSEIVLGDREDEPLEMEEPISPEDFYEEIGYTNREDENDWDVTGPDDIAP